MKYLWKCSLCNVTSPISADLVCDSAREGILKHANHSHHVYVTTEQGKYIGLANGLLFNGIQHPTKK